MSTPLPTSALHPQPAHISDTEWALRCELAECYHLVDYFGWNETIFNHISARLPGPAHHYLVNPFGLNYCEITPGNLLKVDLEGKKLEDSPYDGNPAGFALHAAIHAAREDVHCVIHTHTTAVSAVVQKQSGIDHHNFYGAQLYNRVGYHSFEGITLFAEEKGRMAQSLGDKHVLVLRNHGIAVAEASIAQTFFLHWIVQRAVEIQCAAGALPGPDVQLAESVQDKCRDLAANLISESHFAKMFFAAMVRKMHKDIGSSW